MKQHLLSDPRLVDGVVADFKALRDTGYAPQATLEGLYWRYDHQGPAQFIVKRWLRHLERAERTDWVVVITDVQSGQEMARYELKRHDTTDERHWADEYAESCDMEIDDSDGYIPNCSGDIHVTVYSHPDDIGGGLCWSSESFYFKPEE